MTSRQLGEGVGPARRLPALLVGLLLAVVTIVVGAPAATAQNGVGPQPTNSILGVGPQATAAPNHAGLNGLPLRQTASATGVAANTGIGAADCAAID